MKIRVLRVIEYTYDSPEKAAKDMLRWTLQHVDKEMTMKSVSMPMEVIFVAPDAGKSS